MNFQEPRGGVNQQPFLLYYYCSAAVLGSPTVYDYTHVNIAGTSLAQLPVPQGYHTRERSTETSKVKSLLDRLCADLVSCDLVWPTTEFKTHCARVTLFAAGFIHLHLRREDSFLLPSSLWRFKDQSPRSWWNYMVVLRGPV